MSQHLNQKKRKKKKDREATQKQWPNFKISDIENDYTTTDGSSDEEDWLFVFSDASFVFITVIFILVSFFLET